MYAFLVLLFPIALFRHFAREGNKIKYTGAWIEMAISIILCACKAFLAFSYRVASASFMAEWVYFFVSLTVIPLFCSCAVLLIMKLFKKNITDCVCALFATLAAFYAVYLPFTTLSGARSAYSAYELFFRPALYLMMITSIASSAKLIVASLIDRSLHLRRMGYPMLMAFALIPSLIDTVWFTNIKRNMTLGLWCAYMAISVFWYAVCAPKDTSL